MGISFYNTLEDNKTAFEFEEFDLPLLKKSLKHKPFLRSFMASSLFCMCDDSRALDNFGVCGGMPVKLHAFYCKDCTVKL